MVELMSRELRKNPITKVGAYFLRPLMSAIGRETNYENAGGAPLLGVNGTVIISHGISSAKAIQNAIRVGGDMVTQQLNERIVEFISNAGHKSAPSPERVEGK
jgi:glycerol-3-phosphate acyltransferase PlsX